MDADPMHDDTHCARPDMEVDWRTPYGVSWTPVGDGAIERHAHALLTAPDQVWLVDPIDCAGLDDELESLGTVAGVVVLFGRHMRDAEALARRHGVQLHVPSGTASAPRDAIELGDVIEGTPLRVMAIRDFGSKWVERGLWWAEHSLLVVPESLGSADLFRAGTDAALAVHPLLRIAPPRAAFRRAEPKIVLCGHGPAVTEGATEAVRAALDESRRKAPQFVLGAASDALATVFHRGVHAGGDSDA